MFSRLINLPIIACIFLVTGMLSSEIGISKANNRSSVLWTTTKKEYHTCAVCDEKSVQKVIVGTNTYGGSPDLDFRPPEMARTTMYTWVRRCPSCGYCYADIREATAVAKETVHSKAYKSILDDPDRPALATSFLCNAYILEREGIMNGAAWAAICAAWVSDDAADPILARACRHRALMLVEQGEETGQVLSEYHSSHIAVKVDVLRRARRFSEAKTLIELYEKDPDDDVIGKTMVLQRDLIKRNDDSCHSLAEVWE